MNTKLILTVFVLLIITMYPQKDSSAGKGKSSKISYEKLWEVNSHQPFMASPTIANGKVFIGGIDSTLYCIEINSGVVSWKFKTKGQIRSQAVHHAGKVFLNGGDGFLYALDARNAKVVWKFAAKGEAKYDFADYFQSTPVLNGDVLYFGSGDTYIYAVRITDGKLLWQYKTEGIVHTTAAIDNNSVYFGSFDGHVYALQKKNGKLQWKFKTVGHRYFPKGEVQGNPVAFGDVVIVGARDYNVYALDKEKGFCRWNKAFTKGWCLANTIYDSILYTAGADERVLIAANPLTGKENWKREMEFLIFGNAAFHNGLMFIGTTIGKMHGIKLASGKKLWHYATEAYRTNRLKYFKEDDSYRDDIYSIITSNEHFLQVEFELGGIFSTPVFTEGKLIFSSTDGKITCLQIDDLP